MLTSAAGKLIQGTWTVIQGDDPRDPIDLPRIVLRDGVAWYCDAPGAVGYYEVDNDGIVIGLPLGANGIETITARLIGDGVMLKLSGLVEQTDADGEPLCHPCILMKSLVRSELPRTACHAATALLT